MKKILIVVVSVLLVVSAYYLYKNNISSFSSIQTSNSGVSTSISSKVFPSIFLNINKNYNDLNTYEKGIVNSFFKNNPQSVIYLRDEYGAGENYKDELKLRFYNENFAIFYFPVSIKGGDVIMLYNITNHQSSNIDKDINIFGNSVESDNYIVAIDDNGIKYLKVGNTSFSVVGNSAISAGETYVKQGGFGNVYDAALMGNILKISIFKQENRVDTSNTKLREVKFVLQ